MPSQDGMKAVVLAAGVGSRLDPLTRQLPKPMVPFVNRPVMEHIIRLLKRHGFTRTVSNVHYMHDKVTNFFGTGSSLGVEMDFVYEPTLSGDAGGVRACRDYIGNSTFLVIMGDLITDLDLSYVVQQHHEKGAVATIALKQVHEVERFGVVVLNHDSLITGFQEKPPRKQAKSNLASTGVYVFEPEIFDYIEDKEQVGFGKDVFPRLVSDKLPVLGVETWGYWSDVGTIEQYQRSTQDALEGLIDLQLAGDPFQYGWKQDSATVGERAHIEGLLQLGHDAHISDGVRVKGYAVIGDHCLIEHGSVLENAIIWPGTIVGANSHINNSVIGGNCYINKGSRLSRTTVVEPLKRSERHVLATANEASYEYAAGEEHPIAAEQLELDADRHS
ncbi:MAG TPA: NDP-sugar synthase [Candidatus Obscuribacterales bacterium]